jgi:hypothetical protein
MCALAARRIRVRVLQVCVELTRAISRPLNAGAQAGWDSSHRGMIVLGDLFNSSPPV